MCNPRRVKVTATRDINERWEIEVQRCVEMSEFVRGEARITQSLQGSLGEPILLAIQRALEEGVAGWEEDGDVYRHDVEGGYVSYRPATQELEIRLSPGTTSVSGTVVDRGGAAVPGVYVRALRRHDPRSPAIMRIAHASSWQTTRSDAAGRFRIDAGPRDVFLLDAYGDGFAKPPQAETLLVRAGATDVKLVVDRVRVFRIRLVNSVDGTPVGTHASLFSLVAGPKALQSPVLDELVYTGSSWLRTYDRNDDPSVHEGCVRVTGDPSASVRLVLAVPSFRACTVSLDLRLPSTLISSNAGQEVRMVPEAGAEFGVVRVRAVPANGNYWTPSERFLYVAALDASTAPDHTIVSGVRENSGRTASL